MNELLAHIKAENAKTQAWIDEDPANRWAGMIVEDLDHWAEYGVHTVAQYERYRMEANIWDLYKDVHGVRPRWMNVGEMSDEELSKEFDSLLEQLRANNEREEAMKQEAIREFESTVTRLISQGAGDRETAIRWLLDDERDVGYFEYHNGLPYGYLKEAV